MRPGRSIASFRANQMEIPMSALRIIASVSLALLLGSGAALAQAARDNPDNPHSTANKDRPSPGDSSNTQTQQVE